MVRQGSRRAANAGNIAEILLFDPLLAAQGCQIRVVQLLGLLGAGEIHIGVHLRSESMCANPRCKNVGDFLAQFSFMGALQFEVLLASQ